MGKGSTRRDGPAGAYEDGWERTFGRRVRGGEAGVDRGQTAQARPLDRGSNPRASISVLDQLAAIQARDVTVLDDQSPAREPSRGECPQKRTVEGAKVVTLLLPKGREATVGQS